MPDPTPDLSERLRVLDAAATPGPWAIGEYPNDDVILGGPDQHAVFVVDPPNDEGGPIDPDAALILALVNAYRSGDLQPVAPLRDLDDRLAEKVALLHEMADAASSHRERNRLRGKAEGVDLARSFLNELLRDRDVLDRRPQPEGETHA